MDKMNWVDLARNPMRVMSEGAKHVADAIVIPGGFVVAVAGWMDLINKALTLVILILTVVWTYYRIIDLKETVSERRRKKHEHSS